MLSKNDSKSKSVSLNSPSSFGKIPLNHPHLGNRSCLEVEDSDLIRNPISIRIAHLYQ